MRRFGQYRPCFLISVLSLVGLAALSLAGCGSDGSDNGDTSGDAPKPTTVYGADDPAHVLIVHSFHPELLWEQELNEGILAGLAEGGYSEAAGNLVLDYFWMDTAYFTHEEYLAAVSFEAQAKIRTLQPDLVIATDNPAIQWVVASWPDDVLPFVYAGLDGSPRNIEGLSGRDNITGVLEITHISETLAWISQILPEATQVTFLADDSVTTAAYAAEAQMRIAGSVFGGSQLYATNSFVEWQALVIEASETSDALIVGTYQTLEDENGEFVDPPEVMAWTVENSTIPVVPLWEFGVREGGLGGTVISGQTQGYEAALKAVRILNGESPGNIEVTVPRSGKLTLNTEAAKRWNIRFAAELIQVSTLYGLEDPG